MDKIFDQQHTAMAEEDIREMVRLLGEVAALDGDHIARKRFLMEGLCALIEVDTWIWAVSQPIKPGGVQAYSGILHGGLDDRRYAKLLQAIEHAGMRPVAAPFYQRLFERGITTTMSRDEIDPDGLSYQGEIGEYWKAADVGSLIMTAQVLEDGCLSGIGIYRRCNDPPFTAREIQIAHIINDSVRWLHLLGWPEDRHATIPKLPPQQRLILNLLLDGKNRRQIAALTELSTHTVDTYSKQLFRRFEVHSQSELIARFFRPNTS